MRVLLDTHVFLWAAAQPERLGWLEALIGDPSATWILSAASSWEIAIKHALGKLPLPDPPRTWVPEAMRRLATEGPPVEHRHALDVAALPPQHTDPFDRLLVVQAQLDIPIATADDTIATCAVEVLRP